MRLLLQLTRFLQVAIWRCPAGLAEFFRFLPPRSSSIVLAYPFKRFVVCLNVAFFPMSACFFSFLLSRALVRIILPDGFRLGLRSCYIWDRQSAFHRRLDPAPAWRLFSCLAGAAKALSSESLIWSVPDRQVLRGCAWERGLRPVYLSGAAPNLLFSIETNLKRKLASEPICSRQKDGPDANALTLVLWRLYALTLFYLRLLSSVSVMSSHVHRLSRI